MKPIAFLFLTTVTISTMAMDVSLQQQLSAKIKDINSRLNQCCDDIRTIRKLKKQSHNSPIVYTEWGNCMVRQCNAFVKGLRIGVVWL